MALAPKTLCPFSDSPSLRDHCKHWSTMNNRGEGTGGLVMAQNGPTCKMPVPCSTQVTPPKSPPALHIPRPHPKQLLIHFVPLRPGPHFLESVLSVELNTMYSFFSGFFH